MDRRLLQHYNPYLYIWGVQWIISAWLIYVLDMEKNHPVIVITAWIAALGSLIVFVMGQRRSKLKTHGHTKHEPEAMEALNPFSLAAWLYVLFYVLVSIVLIMYAAGQSYFIYDLIRALVLGLFYTVLGGKVGRELIYLGLWLLLLSTILTIWYLGYTSLVLVFFGGLSLIACALLFRIWSRAAQA